MPRTTIEPIVPDFPTIPDLQEGLTAKANFHPRSNLYPRDGSETLGEIQASIAELNGVNDEAVLAYNTGMSAVTEAIDVGLKTVPKETPVIAAGIETYTQTQRYLRYFLPTSVKVVYFDSGDPDDVTKNLERHQPDVIITETIGNYTGVPVLDTQALLEQARQLELPPTIILDNTLPLRTSQPIAEQLDEEDRVIVVESGTKSYTFNAEQLGIGITKNAELLDYLRRLRRTRGSIPGAASLERIRELLPEDQSDFDERNRRLFQSTAAIAIQLAAAVGENEDYLISHPVLASHSNHEYYGQVYPHGGTPLFYIASLNPEINQYQLGEILWRHPGVQGQARLGQSFGFEETRIVTDEQQPVVRISGGSETDGHALGEAMAEALYS